MTMLSNEAAARLIGLLQNRSDLVRGGQVTPRVSALKLCDPCLRTGLMHCADPQNCGGPWGEHPGAEGAKP